MGVLVSNPFAAVDWAGEQVASLTHAHVKEPTTTGITERDYFLALIDAGYRDINLSNYYRSGEPGFPFTTLNGVVEADIPDDVIGGPNGEHFGTYNATGHFAGLGSLAITGVAKNPDGTGGAGFTGSWQQLFDILLGDMLYEDGGGVIINHPNISAYPGHKVAKQMLAYDPRVIGVEMFDNFTRWSPEYDDLDGFSLEAWHVLLSHAASLGRNCFGIANPDHWLESNGHPLTALGANRLLVPAEYAAADRPTREHMCLQAYRDGRFYPVISLPDSPVFTDVTVTDDDVSLTCADPCDISWIWAKAGDDVARSTDPETGTSSTYTFRGDELYVRGEALGATDEARSFTQAVVFQGPKVIDTALLAMILD